jgi:hypothetical protein
VRRSEGRLGIRAETGGAGLRWKAISSASLRAVHPMSRLDAAAGRQMLEKLAGARGGTGLRPKERGPHQTRAFPHDNRPAAVRGRSSFTCRTIRRWRSSPPMSVSQTFLIRSLNRRTQGERPEEVRDHVARDLLADPRALHRRSTRPGRRPAPRRTSTSLRLRSTRWAGPRTSAATAGFRRRR